MDFLPLEIFMVLLCIWQFQMRREGNKSNRVSTIIGIIVAIAGLVVAMATLYNGTPSGFAVKVYPNTQLDFCSENGQLIFEHESGLTPKYCYTDDSGQIHCLEKIRLITNTNDSKYNFYETILVNDIDPPFWTFGHVIKPYRDQVALTIENGLPGINMAFANSSFGAEMEDNSRIQGVPPFNAQLSLKIARNATLTEGPHYITIRGIGQDGKESKCYCVLMVNKICSRRTIVVV